MKLRAIYVQNRIMSILLLSLLFMWLMPYGSFKPSESGFYLSIVSALFIEIVNWKLVNKYRDKKEISGRFLVVENRIMSILLLSLVFMWLMPFGSFNSSKVGFYLSIGLALFLEIVNWKLIKKHQTYPENFEFSNKTYKLTDNK